MYIDEIKSDTNEISITARLGRKVLRFESTISDDCSKDTNEIYKLVNEKYRGFHGIICEPFTYKEKVLNFANPYNTLKLSAMIISKNRLFRWDYVTVETIKTGDRYLHLVAAKDEGKEAKAATDAIILEFL